MQKLVSSLMPAVETVAARLAPIEGLGDMFRRCFLSTAETTVSMEDNGETFVITGDIPAMWLRDSTAQVLHYVRFAKDEVIAALIEGLIARQVRYINLDPYANSFNREPNGARYSDDRPPQIPWVWEQKYEIDSLCYPMLLAYRYQEQTGSSAFLSPAFHQAMRNIVRVFATEQRHETDSPYRFERDNCPPSDTLTRDGKGAEVAYTGMTWSGFRPSDDACRYGYLVPANLFAVNALTWIAGFAQELIDPGLASQAKHLAGEIRQGVERHARVTHPNHGEIYAYETDGMGHYTLMDDANVPSLLSLPYLGVCANDDPLYLRTRAFVLSEDNRYFYSGKYAQGIGSPHTPCGYIWHIALCMQAMTTDDLDEQAALLRMLTQTHAGTGFMHEGFDPDAPERFTREWFAWANSLFGEMIYRLYERGTLDEVVRLAR